jgi:transcriptional regulator with XRE-family HTH domain
MAAMTSAEDKKTYIGRTFRHLRVLLGLRQADLVVRSGGELKIGEVGKVEQGKSLLSTTTKRSALAKAFGLDMDSIDRLIEGQLTPEQAAKLAKGEKPGLASPVRVRKPIQEGETMATFVRLQHATKSRFPGLETCVLFYELSGPLPWHVATIELARSGNCSGGKDLTPLEWKKLLDALDDLTRKVVVSEQAVDEKK